MVILNSKKSVFKLSIGKKTDNRLPIAGSRRPTASYYFAFTSKLRYGEVASRLFSPHGESSKSK